MKELLDYIRANGPLVIGVADDPDADDKLFLMLWPKDRPDEMRMAMVTEAELWTAAAGGGIHFNEAELLETTHGQ